MSDAGTLLSELDGARPSDGDLVDSILSDLNQSGQGNAPPPMGVRGQVKNVQQLQSNFPTAIDPAVPTAHLIGHDHPTPADFQRMMANAQGPLPFNAAVPQMQQQQPKYMEPEKNWQGQWIDELKQPILVAIIVFLVTLPAIHLLVNHYAPSLLLPGGNFNTIGNLARAVSAGLLYWILQRVIAPLLSI
jgi:hypothetical protein